MLQSYRKGNPTVPYVKNINNGHRVTAVAAGRRAAEPLCRSGVTHSGGEMGVFLPRGKQKKGAAAAAPRGIDGGVAAER
jgi:hypothetical protein